MTDAKSPAAMFPVDLEGSPKVTLAGREWAIPKLAIKQATKVVPAIISLGPTILRLADAAAAKGDQSQLVGLIALLDEAAFNTVADIVFHSLTRGYPTIGRGEFDNMPISVVELFEALPVILKQVGFLEPRKGETAATGEAGAGSSSTGTSSSPASAA